MALEEKIKFKTLALVRTKIGETDQIMVGKSSLQSIEYQVFEDPDLDSNAQKQNSKKKKEDKSDPEKKSSPFEFLLAYLSKHVAIPYKIAQNQDNYIEIKYLNDFSGDETDEVL